MNDLLREVCTSLDDLAISIVNAYSDDRAMSEVWGWNCPPLNRQDLAFLSSSLSDKLKQLNIEAVDDTTSEQLRLIPMRITIFKEKNLAYLFNGNGSGAAPQYISLIKWIEATIDPIFGWEVLQDNKAMPMQLSRRLRGIRSDLDALAPEKDDLERRVKLIHDATGAAESLPTDLQSLKEARAKVDKFSSDAAELYGKIDTYFKQSDRTSKDIDDKKQEADRLVAQCEEAYRITTTKGLAAAFDQRASRLNQTMWIWVGGLLLSLIAGGLIGASRFQALAKTLEATNPHWGVIWMDFILSIIGLAAPIWFAWIATRQISQRFRLAEDYAFKASVAKAYEGYRKEAARIDPDFEARLFGSALLRLEEAPLRLVELDSHSSPWHEFFASPGFQKALDIVPELKNSFTNLTREGLKALKKDKPVPED